MNSRRQFVLKLAPLAGAAALLPRLAGAQDLPALTEADPMAVALGFKLDTNKADQVKFPKHTKEQSCASCVHFMKVRRRDLALRPVQQDGAQGRLVQRLFEAPLTHFEVPEKPWRLSSMLHAAGR